jgi:hypothetical protein
MSCKSSTLFYGDTGEGKTAQLASWAKYVKKSTGKKVRLYTAEPAGLGTIEHLIMAGLIDVWDISTRPNHFESMDFAARGYWPVPDGSSKLLPPDAKVYETYGGFAYEGATAFGELLLEELRVKGAANEIVGAEKAPQQFTSGSLRIAGANQTFYGIVQSRVRKAINDSQRLPVHILWTARELKVRDEDDPKKQYVYGPLLAGSAATLSMPAWFGNTIHISARKQNVTDPVTKKQTEKIIRKAYFTKHYDEGSDIPYLAQLRLPPELKSEIPDAMELDSSLDSMVKLFTQIDELRKKASEQLTI